MPTAQELKDALTDFEQASERLIDLMDGIQPSPIPASAEDLPAQMVYLNHFRQNWTKARELIKVAEMTVRPAVINGLPYCGTAPSEQFLPFLSVPLPFNKGG